MTEIVGMFWWRVISLLKSRKRLEAENLVPRHQIAVLRYSDCVIGALIELCSFGSTGCGQVF